jgi:hypothetical protein
MLVKQFAEGWMLSDQPVHVSDHLFVTDFMFSSR